MSVERGRSGRISGVSIAELWRVDAPLHHETVCAVRFAHDFDDEVSARDKSCVSSWGSGRIARPMVAGASGHGTGVAETGRTLIHRYINHVDQRKLLTSMNDAFVALARRGPFATAVVMTHHAPSARLSPCNAGRPPPPL